MTVLDYILLSRLSNGPGWMPWCLCKEQRGAIGFCKRQDATWYPCRQRFKFYMRSRLQQAYPTFFPIKDIFRSNLFKLHHFSIVAGWDEMRSKTRWSTILFFLLDRMFSSHDRCPVKDGSNYLLAKSFWNQSKEFVWALDNIFKSWQLPVVRTVSNPRILQADDHF